MEQEIKEDSECENSENVRRCAADGDTYIRKNAYSITGRLYHDHSESRARILNILEDLFRSDNEKVRQTAVYVTGEIGRTGERCGTETDDVTRILEIALADEHHSVRNTMIGALKRMGEKNPGTHALFCKNVSASP
ncbi:MAG: HEAT repeat domain-containing protein [Euryarchaeota archaeon]|nr:HEAT repeat domain-containing protein [Euryarchaeota archaeon]